MRYESKISGSVGIPSEHRVLLDHVDLREQDYSGRELIQFCAISSRLERCCFQRVRITKAEACFGAGREMSEFIECSFDGARIEMGGGHARFLRCSFRDVDIRNWRGHTLELVDCTFSGRLKRGVFFGAVPPEKQVFLRRDRNEFRGNDFAAMELIDVMFRLGVDLSQQRLPSGSQYLYLPNAARAIMRARAEIITWQPGSDAQRVALTIVNTLGDETSRGQRQLFLRPDDYYSQTTLPREAIDKVFALLRNEVGMTE
jgi:hypothetical protein